MTICAVVLSQTNVRPSLFMLLTADVALLVVVVASLSLRGQRRRRKKFSTDQAIRCGRCQQLIPPDKYNCASCGWPHVPERNEEPSDSHEGI